MNEIETVPEDAAGAVLVNEKLIAVGLLCDDLLLLLT